MASEIAVCFHFCFRKRFRRREQKRFRFPLPHPSLRRGGTEARSEATAGNAFPSRILPSRNAALAGCTQAPTESERMNDD
jgi:hypothetical protein